MWKLAKPSKEPSQITLSVLLTGTRSNVSSTGRNREDSSDSEEDVYELDASSCEYQKSRRASWKIAVSRMGNNARVTVYCRRKLTRDTVQAVYSVRLISNSSSRFTQRFFKQGHVIFSGRKLETTATVDINVDSTMWNNIYSSSDTSLEMHITVLDLPADDMKIYEDALREDNSMKIYEDAFNSVDKAQLFSESSPYASDCVILFDDKKEVYVNKTLLSLHSDWWKDTFAKYKDRVPLTNVAYDQFLDFLSVIYTIGHPITVKNVETLSKFAHDFEMTELLNRCDIFLMANSAKFGGSKLLLLAQNYNLERLQAQCLSEYKSVEDIKAIKTEPEYAHLLERTKRLLLDKILKIYRETCTSSSSSESDAPVRKCASSSSSESDAPMPKCARLVINERRSTNILDKLASLSPCPSNIVLVIGNAKIHAHTQILSYHSEFFYKMFENEFKESRESEITLEQFRYEEMVELLSVTYPSDYAINETNIATIVKLADFYQMPMILDRCKQELKNSTKIRLVLKLWLAQQYYSMSDMQVEFALKCKSIKDVKKLTYQPAFKLLDDHTRALILESITR